MIHIQEKRRYKPMSKKIVIYCFIFILSINTNALSDTIDGYFSGGRLGLIFKPGNRVKYHSNDPNFQGDSYYLYGVYTLGPDDFGTFINFNFDNPDKIHFLSFINNSKCYYIVEHGVLVLYTETIIIDVLIDGRYYYRYGEVLYADYFSDSVLVEYPDNLDYFSPQNLYHYDAVTQDLTRLWWEGSEDPGESVIIKTDFHSSRGEINSCMITGVIIFNGYFSREDLYYKNNRVKDAIISFGEKSVRITIEDIRKPQIVLLNFVSNDIKPIYFQIESVYKGTQWDDTSITKMIYFGYIGFMQG
jgi:hypothetical protein